MVLCGARTDCQAAQARACAGVRPGFGPGPRRFLNADRFPGSCMNRTEWTTACSTRLAKALIFRSEEHTSELQSLMRTSYAVFCWKKQKKHTTTQSQKHQHRKNTHSQ